MHMRLLALQSNSVLRVGAIGPYTAPFLHFADSRLDPEFDRSRRNGDVRTHESLWPSAMAGNVDCGWVDVNSQHVRCVVPMAVAAQPEIAATAS